MKNKKNLVFLDNWHNHLFYNKNYNGLEKKIVLSCQL